MSNVKVVVLEAGSELEAALLKLLGGSVDVAGEQPIVDEVVEVDEDDLVEEDEEFFGQIVEADDSEQRVKRSYFVGDYTDLSVRVTNEGVVVSGTSVDGVEMNDTISPQGGFDEVTAVENDGVLTVRLYHLPAEGREVEIN